MRRIVMLVGLLAALVSCSDGGGNASSVPDRRAAIVRNEAIEEPPELPPSPEPAPARARVRLVTDFGTIDIEVNGRAAPITATNFLAYVDRGRFDGTHFYRAARTRGMPERGFIQGGIQREYRRMLAPIRHEPTTETGLSHVTGTVSMARTTPGTAMGDFFITTGDIQQMDADPRGATEDRRAGYAAFGRVVAGMDVVRRILASPTVPNAGRGAMKGQMMARQVRIVSARRLP